MDFRYKIGGLAGNVYGELRGYKRHTIWRQVNDNLKRSPDDLKREAARLFLHHVFDCMRRFPEYAKKVETHLGASPKPDAAIDPRDLPLWTKTDQNRLFAGLTAPPITGSWIHSTGGSTATPVRFYISRPSYEWRMAVTSRGYAWAGAPLGRKAFHIWGLPTTKPGLQKRLKERVQFFLWQRKVFDAYQKFDDDRKSLCCRMINAQQPETIVGYSSYLVELARFVRAHPQKLTWKAKVIVPAAEGLQPGQRELLEENLGGEVSLSYGTREFGFIGMECRQHSGYHLASDNLFVEIVDERGMPVEPGEPGRVLVTDLRNAATPFVRYALGDVAVMEPESRRCACGLPFPVLRSVEGRTQDVLYLPNGEKLSALFVSYVARQFQWIEGFQVVQRARDHILLKLISTVNLTPALSDPVAEKLRGRLGMEMRIDFERVNELTRTKSGKVAFVTNHSDRDRDKRPGESQE
ncbi:MAG: hypothetical protein OEN01_16625 [Candidatus Krumholzibacteria bacterium]|nr:hypothetical protein [Candidatus Krumholzibacteria bacterium]